MNACTYILISVVLIFSAAVLNYGKILESNENLDKKLDGQYELMRVLNSGLDNTSKKVDYVIDQGAGFRVVNNSELIPLAIRMLRHSKSMRVMASPKPDDSETTIDNSQAKYFSETEEFLNKSPHFQYGRICKTPESDAIKRHFDKILSLGN